jgi:hypothetical protein
MNSSFSLVSKLKIVTPLNKPIANSFSFSRQVIFDATKGGIFFITSKSFSEFREMGIEGNFVFVGVRVSGNGVRVGGIGVFVGEIILGVVVAVFSMLFSSMRGEFV